MGSYTGSQHVSWTPASVPLVPGDRLLETQHVEKPAL